MAESRDLVQKERPTVGKLEPTRSIALRAGEGPPYVAEELAFEEPV